MQNRRTFLKKTLIGTGISIVGQFPWQAMAHNNTAKIPLTILHTNDVHSHLDPFPLDDKLYGGQGGVAARMEAINIIRNTEKNVLLLDAGDIFQGTPYFNLYKGEPEIKAMSLMQYDAATMGNHDFDATVGGFAQQLAHASFPILIANYDFSKTELKGKTEPYKIFNIASLQIGVFGIGIKLHGLVSPECYGKTYYHDPIITANEVAKHLKKQGCDMVICLSHLGYDYKSDKLVSDKILATQSTDIDLIIGGHTHTFLHEPTIIKNANGNAIIINQVGWAGLRLGRLDYEFEKNIGSSLLKSNTVILTKETNE